MKTLLHRTIRFTLVAAVAAGSAAFLTSCETPSYNRGFSANANHGYSSSFDWNMRPKDKTYWNDGKQSHHPY